MTDAAGGWTTLSGSTIGSHHRRTGRPLQDAVHTWCDGGQAVLAVADGHGHEDHFRSDTGAALAVVSAVEELRRLLPEVAELDGPDTREAIEQRLQTAGAAILATWRDKIAHHREAHPFTEVEVADHGAALDPVRAYGTTLLAAALTGDLLVFLQVGDGDSVAVGTDGAATRPLPEDPDLDGVRTSSLCQPDPLASLRTGVLDASEVALVYLCTDGFGTARVDADWWSQTGAQLVQFTRERGIGWVEEQLPSWLEEPASIGGDDTTMALLVRTTIGADQQA